ncbi:MAG: hypothetical protein ACK439_11545, partial [Novosphingobium sp.]
MIRLRSGVLLLGGIVLAGATPAMAQKAGTMRFKAPPAAAPKPPPEPVLPDAQGCPVSPGRETAADWRPPPIPPKVAQGGEAAADWRPPPIPPRDPN